MLRASFRFFSCVLLGCLPSVALAAEIPDTRLLLAKMGGGLLLVLLLVAVLVWSLKRLPGLARSSGVMAVRGTLMLGPRERLVLVDVAGEQLLLGVSQGRIELLRSIDVDQASASENKDASQKPQEGPFSEKLKQLMGARRV